MVEMWVVCFRNVGCVFDRGKTKYWGKWGRIFLCRVKERIESSCESLSALDLDWKCVE